MIHGDLTRSDWKDHDWQLIHMAALHGAFDTLRWLLE